MKNWLVGCLTIWFGLGLSSGLELGAQPDLGKMIHPPQNNRDTLYRPVKYPISPEAGLNVICYRSFVGENSRDLAEELAEYIRTQYRLPAYILDWTAVEKAEHRKRIEEKRKIYQELITKYGRDKVQMDLWVKSPEIREQYGIFIGGRDGGWKDDLTALKVLKEIRKQPLPPEKFMDMVVQIASDKNAKVSDKGLTKDNHEKAPINPASTAFVCRNPTIAAARMEDKPDPFLKKLNAGETYSLLEAKKKWTVVVRVYQGAVTIVEKDVPTGNAITNLFKKPVNPYMLQACALNAHETAKFLREQFNPPFESYVLHTVNSSIVCVGSYDSEIDPKLIQMQKQLAGLKLKRADNVILEEMIAQPPAMKIPRP